MHCDYSIPSMLLIHVEKSVQCQNILAVSVATSKLNGIFLAFQEEVPIVLRDSSRLGYLYAAYAWDEGLGHKIQGAIIQTRWFRLSTSA